MTEAINTYKKQDILKSLEKEYTTWDQLLKQLKEEQISFVVYDHMTVKDVVAHVKAWQEISIARLLAATTTTSLMFPKWAGDNPDEEKETDRINLEIYKLYQDNEWDDVYRSWRSGFQQFLELAKKIDDNLLEDKKKYEWLHGYSLYDVLKGSYEHHEEHLKLLHRMVF